MRQVPAPGIQSRGEPPISLNLAVVSIHMTLLLTLIFIRGHFHNVNVSPEITSGLIILRKTANLPSIQETSG